MQFQQFYVVQGASGAAIADASATLFEADGVTLATIYNTAGVPIPNPATADGTGLVGFAAANGSYVVQFQSGAYVSPPFNVTFLDPATLTPAALFAAMQTAGLFAGFGGT